MTVSGSTKAIDIPGAEAGDRDTLAFPKRKRGRPKTNPSPSTSLEEEEASTVAGSTTSEENNSSTSSSSTSSSSTPEEDNSLDSLEAALPRSLLDEKGGLRHPGGVTPSEENKEKLEDSSPKQTTEAGQSGGGGGAKAKGKKGKKGGKGKPTRQQTKRQHSAMTLGTSPPFPIPSVVPLPPPPKKGIVKKASVADATPAAGAATHGSEASTPPQPNSPQWKIRFSVTEGAKQFYVEKQALPCVGKPVATEPLDVKQAELPEGLWFLVRQDRNFSKPLPAQFRSVGNVRETRVTNQQKNFTKSRPPAFPKRGQVMAECWVESLIGEGEAQELGKENEVSRPAYIRQLSLESSVTSSGKTPLQLVLLEGDGDDAGRVVLGVRTGHLHFISLFVPMKDIPPAWQSLASQSLDVLNEESETDDGSQSPVKKKRKEDPADNGCCHKSSHNHHVSFSNDLSVRYYIGPLSCKRPKKAKGGANPQLDRCADVKISASDKLGVTKQNRSKLTFQQLIFSPPTLPGIPSSEPSESTITTTTTTSTSTSTPARSSEESPLSPELDYTPEEQAKLWASQPVMFAMDNDGDERPADARKEEFVDIDDTVVSSSVATSSSS